MLLFLGVSLLILFFLIPFFIGATGNIVDVSPEDKIIKEMRTQRAKDYFNNPVVNEMKRERFFDKK